jgi:hypothetical protein
MNIRFKIDPDRINLNDQIALEELETLTARQLRDLLGHFLVDENDNYLDLKKGQEVAGLLTKTQQIEALKKFDQAVKDLQAGTAVPLASGGS